ncbi:MAG: site-2 protease family protein [Pyrinomonadaceae bacterium]
MQFFDFLKRKVVIAHVYGIPVRADYRWFFVLLLLSWITAASINSYLDNFLTSGIFGILTTLIFFGSIFLHELAHAFIARMEGLQVLEIILHPFGGMARFRREPETPQAEFRIAIAGPVASFLLSLVFISLMIAFNSLGEGNILSPLCFLLFLLNFLIAVFNMFPGYPLDGGRVLRSFLWKRGTDLNEATVLTGRFGQIIGGVMLVFGVFTAFVHGQFFLGFWTVVVGIFLFDSARSIIRQVKNLDKLIVEDVMTLPIPIKPEMTVLHFVDHILPAYRQTVFPVARERQLYGMLLLADLKELPREDWNRTEIKEVMRPIEPEFFVESRFLLSDARELMRFNGIGALGVIDSRGNLVGFLQNRKIR